MGAKDEPDRTGATRDPAAEKTAHKRRARQDADVGVALRSVYQKTVEEKVPDEFLDLLGKLG